MCLGHEGWAGRVPACGFLSSYTEYTCIPAPVKRQVPYTVIEPQLADGLNCILSSLVTMPA